MIDQDVDIETDDWGSSDSTESDGTEWSDE